MVAVPPSNGRGYVPPVNPRVARPPYGSGGPPVPRTMPNPGVPPGDPFNRDPLPPSPPPGPWPPNSGVGRPRVGEGYGPRIDIGYPEGPFPRKPEPINRWGKYRKTRGAGTRHNLSITPEMIRRAAITRLQ